MGVQNQIYAHKIKLVGGTKRVVEKSKLLITTVNGMYDCVKDTNVRLSVAKSV